MKNKTVYDLTLSGIFIALYVVLTVALTPISYSILQFRVSEILLLLPFYNRKFTVPSTIAVAVANAFNPQLPLLDILVGVLIAIISYTLVIKIRNKYIDAILYSILCGILVSAEFAVVAETDPIGSFLFGLTTVTASQSVICIAGVALINNLVKIRFFRERIIDW